jgi:hypothetical protein
MSHIHDIAEEMMREINETDGPFTAERLASPDDDTAKIRVRDDLTDREFDEQEARDLIAEFASEPVSMEIVELHETWFDALVLPSTDEYGY